MAILIREAFLRGISTRQVGRIVATFTGEPLTAQTFSKLVTELDQAVEQFHLAHVTDEQATAIRKLPYRSRPLGRCR